MSSTHAQADLIATLEAVEAEAVVAMAEALSPGEARMLGAALRRDDGLVSQRAARLDLLAHNRVIGFGLHPGDTERLDDLIAWFRDAGVPRFFVQSPPVPRADELRRDLTAHGLAHYSNWVKLTRSATDSPRGVTDLRVERIGAGHAPSFAAIATRSFGWPDAIRPWLAALVGRPAWRHYLAFDGDQPVATGALFVRDGTGWMSFAATDPAHRGRGAQSALIARRIADARSLGCDRLIVETPEDSSERRATSFHNLRRLGFDLAYLRANYLWTAPPGTRPAA